MLKLVAFCLHCIKSDRAFVFVAINEFLHKCDRISDSEVLASLRASAVATFIESALPQGNRGYFTIASAPSSGKSVILAKYIKLWHLDTGEVIASFTGDSRRVHSALTPGGVFIFNIATEFRSDCSCGWIRNKTEP